MEELEQEGLDTGRGLVVDDPEHVLEQVDDYFLVVVHLLTDEESLDALEILQQVEVTLKGGVGAVL